MILLTATAGSGAFRDTTVLTTLHLILIGVLAALTILGLLWGMRQKRLRKAGEEAEAERAEALEASPAPAPEPDTTAQVQSQRQVSEPVAAPLPAPAPVPTEPPVAPAPPPLGAMGLGQPAPPAAASGYQLSDIKGLGPKAVPLLAAQGVTSVADLAALDDARAAAVDAELGALRGRLTRDRWVEQARLLDAGDRAGFEATFGKL